MKIILIGFILLSIFLIVFLVLSNDNEDNHFQSGITGLFIVILIVTIILSIATIRLV